MSKQRKDAPSLGMQRQFGIYLAGLQGQRPAQPTLVEQLREEARAALTPEAWGYLEGAAGAEETMRANREAFRRRQIVPRMLRGVGDPDLGTELLDRALEGVRAHGCTS